MTVLLLVLGCGGGVEAVRADLEKGGLTVLEVKPREASSGEAYEYAGHRDGQFCIGDVGSSGTSLGCISSTSGTSFETCSTGGGLLERGWRCAHLSDGSACNDAGVAMYKDDKPDAYANFVQGCEFGYADACRNAGVIDRDGLLGRKADLVNAGKWFELGCDKGSGLACAQRGAMLSTGEHKHGCGTDALRWFERSVANYPVGANEVGAYHDNCPDGDALKAREAFKTACDAGLGMACRNLSLMLEFGRGGAADLPASVAMLETACAAKEPSTKACNDRAEGKEPAEAALWFGKACDAGDLDACLDFAVSLVRADANDRGADAIAASKKACDGGKAVGCRNLGVLLRDGLLGGTKSPDEARPHLQKACDLGDQPACKDLTK